MVAFNLIATLFLAISLAAAQPINEQLVGRDMSSQVVSSRFESLSKEVSDIRQSINNGLSQTEARQRIEKMASSASQTFRASQQCTTCFGQGTASSWSHSASSTYKEISSLAQTVNQKYGSAAPQVFSSVRQLDGLMSQNLNSFSRSGVAVQSLLPSQSAQVFGQLGLSQTAHIAKETSSSSSSSSMTKTGGPGGMSTQVVSSRFESLSREVSDIRQSINNGLSQTEARQRIEKLASSASQTFRASQQCITCFDQGTASSWSHSASSTYKEISSLAQTVNQKYGSAAPQVFSPVKQLDGLMSQNLNSFSRSGVAVQSLLPSQSAQVFGQLGLSQTAHIANHTSSSSQTGGSSPHP